MSAIALLCEIIALGGKAPATTYGQHPEFKTLLRGGYVRESGVVQAVECIECDETHDAEIIYDAGRYGYFCPDIGFVHVDRDEIATWQPDLSAIVAGLADAFDCKRRKSAPLKGATWRIGTVPSEGGDVSLYFHPSLQDERDAADLLAHLSREIRTSHRVILTTVGTLPIPDAKTALLADTVELNSDGAVFDALVDPRDIVGVHRKRVGGAPNRHKKTLDMLIQSRMNDGTSLSGRNEEAKAIRDILRERNPAGEQPSLPTIKRYVTDARGGL